MTRHVHDLAGRLLATCRSASGTQVRYVRDELDRLRKILLLEDLEPTHECLGGPILVTLPGPPSGGPYAPGRGC